MLPLIYGICYYIKNNKINIFRHLDCFNKIGHSDKEFYIILMDDDKSQQSQESHKKTLLTDLNLVNQSNICCLTSFNWGGTIAGLYILFQHLKSTQTANCYVCYFEEDFRPINTNWLNDSILYLKDNYYLGEGTRQNSQTPDLCELKKMNRVMAGYKCIKVNGYEIECWTDGGYYFSTLEKLAKIYIKIGIFHKGDQTTSYSHVHDGVDFGEVGFPTLLYHNNLKFNGLYRNKYFKHY